MTEPEKTTTEPRDGAAEEIEELERTAAEQERRRMAERDAEGVDDPS